MLCLAFHEKKRILEISPTLAALTKLEEKRRPTMVANMAKKMPNTKGATMKKKKQNIRKQMTNAKIQKTARAKKTRMQK